MAETARTAQHRQERSRPDADAILPARWAWIAATVIAVASFALVWTLMSVIHGLGVFLALPLALAQTGAAFLAVRHPAWSIALGTISTAAVVSISTGWVVAVSGTHAPSPDFPVLAHVALIVLVTLRHGWVRGALLWMLGAFAPVLALVGLNSLAQTGSNGPNAAVLVAFAWPYFVVALGLGGGALAIASVGRVMLGWRASFQQERKLSAEEAAKRREIEERSRIAQELHDVVAHSMSVISVQATTAQYRIDGLDERVRGEFDSIADSSRRALTEMRGLLSLLRTDRDPALAPQPELADLEQLVEATGRSGATIDFEAPELAELASVVPAATGLTAYRVVQEGLSNAVRHAPGADVRVEIAREGEQLRIRVVNGAAPQQLNVEPVPGSGLGLTGLRTRVAALGGTLSAAPEADGGFRLEAALPIG